MSKHHIQVSIYVLRGRTLPQCLLRGRVVHLPHSQADHPAEGEAR
jgi:hypothetical protein